MEDGKSIAGRTKPQPGRGPCWVRRPQNRTSPWRLRKPPTGVQRRPA